MNAPPHPHDTAGADALLRKYAEGLSAEITALRDLAECAAAQRSAADAGSLAVATLRRGEAFARLQACEGGLTLLREEIASALPRYEAMAGFEEVRAVHAAMRVLLAEIEASDEETTRILSARDEELRATAQTLDAVGATITAYRKVIAPPPPAASLVDRRG